ncbi:MAG: M48 family metalloprotease [Candidatus Hadarchaeum sp.]
MKAPDQIKLNHVHTIFLFYGRDLISQLTPAELTAVMLHEIGHYIVRFKEVLYYISRPYLFFPASVALNLLATFSLTKTLLGILPVYVLLLILVNKVCLHPQEMLADRVAVEYGYGDELMSVIGKFEKIDPVASIKEKSFLKRIYFFLKDVFHTHPSSETRIRSIFKQIIKHYPENYPHIKAVLERIPHGKELIT